MELMSSAFVCVLLAMLPQTLGTVRNRNFLSTNLKLNSSAVVIQQKPKRKILLLTTTGPSLVTNNDLQRVFNDLTCKDCDSCMMRAIKAHQSHVAKWYLGNSRLGAKEIREDILINKISRKKRDVSIDNTTEVIFEKKKTKKGKVQKTITVTKYNTGGQVYALKVKVAQLSFDKQNDTESPTTTCQVYSVKKSFPCESPEADTLTSPTKRKVRGKSKNRAERKFSSTTMKPSISVYRKREVDISQVQESFMPSIEEFTD
ncbi:hypothetical protein ACJJTC_017107 [Scirpophaga incertulas]